MGIQTIQIVSCDACGFKIEEAETGSTPKRVLEAGPWWQAAVIGGDANGGRPNPPKRAEQCTRCGGMLPNCACEREHLAATYDDETPAERMDREAAMAAARAALRGAAREEEV